ncbi:hypothetical protein DUNSADRAFT_17635 [Dunaliella salina]|uniref:Uncharacterized protein n=1 Tax=Dunaliella salina TaxID=3046 RepID=A0ABQ7H005_DUNSA|nr:hypothetical protein DUNSADRAFT_17635 [Dunaliella salina]|eukprot:KAF5840151.1 hypothetical protein DUNSADRAFT_17635 [Dunaliella salina]
MQHGETEESLCPGKLVEARVTWIGREEVKLRLAHAEAIECVIMRHNLSSKEHLPCTSCFINSHSPSHSLRITPLCSLDADHHCSCSKLCPIMDRDCFCMHKATLPPAYPLPLWNPHALWAQVIHADVVRLHGDHSGMHHALLVPAYPLLSRNLRVLWAQVLTAWMGSIAHPLNAHLRSVHRSNTRASDSLCSCEIVMPVAASYHCPHPELAEGPLLQAPGFTAAPTYPLLLRGFHKEILGTVDAGHHCPHPEVARGPLWQGPSAAFHAGADQQEGGFGDVQVGGDVSVALERFDRAARRGSGGVLVEGDVSGFGLYQ